MSRKTGPRNTPEFVINAAIYDHWRATYQPPRPVTPPPKLTAASILAALAAAGLTVVMEEQRIRGCEVCESWGRRCYPGEEQ